MNFKETLKKTLYATVIAASLGLGHLGCGKPDKNIKEISDISYVRQGPEDMSVEQAKDGCTNYVCAEYIDVKFTDNTTATIPYLKMFHKKESDSCKTGESNYADYRNFFQSADIIETKGVSQKYVGKEWQPETFAYSGKWIPKYKYGITHGMEVVPRRGRLENKLEELELTKESGKKVRIEYGSTHHGYEFDNVTPIN